MTTKTVNLLGETQKEQWQTAIRCWHYAIVCRIDSACCEIDDEDIVKRLDEAIEYTGTFRDEMLRLVEGVFDD